MNRKNEMMSEILSSPRLILRTPMAGDFELLHEGVFSNASVMRFVLSGTPLPEDRARALFDASFDHEGSGLKLGVLIERDSLTVIGFSGLMECNALGAKDHEIGFVLRRSAWGKGYATEIGRAQLRYGFESAGSTRLLAQVAPDNASSIAVLEKIGMKLHSSAVTQGRGPRHIYLMTRPT